MTVPELTRDNIEDGLLNEARTHSFVFNPFSHMNGPSRTHTPTQNIAFTAARAILQTDLAELASNTAIVHTNPLDLRHESAPYIRLASAIQNAAREARYKKS